MVQINKIWRNLISWWQKLNRTKNFGFLDEYRNIFFFFCLRNVMNKICLDKSGYRDIEI